MTAEEFLAWDETQTVKHEFVNGEVFEMGRPSDVEAMAGAGEAHVVTTGNLFFALKRHLGGTPCRCYFLDMKLRVESADAFFYPDLMVTCSAADSRDYLVKREPILLIEVLSPSTAAYDRGDKFTAYRGLPSLREYALIDMNRRRCDVYCMGPNGLWELHPFEAGQDLQLASVDLVVPNVDLWDEVPEVPRTPSAS